MCGIAGVINLQTEEWVYSKMLATMSRRGPDDQNLFRQDGICLLHTRLAIVDPEQGRQPMQLTWQGEHYVLVYNGELYNTEELRRELLHLNHSFCGHSDTEVVIHSYAQWGEDCVERFNGIFGFAVWEQRSGKLFLARDRIGVKPLFYTQRGRGLLFASEIKTLLAHPEVTPALDAEGAAQLILLGPGRLPGSGVFCNIHELEPGCWGVWQYDRLRIERYWKLRDREHRESFEDTAMHVRFLVTDAIRRQMVSDVPIGTFLSGGLDSSIISAICSDAMDERGAVLPTFSLDYENNDKYYVSNAFQPESDNAYIHMMEQRTAHNSNWTTLSSQTVYDALEPAVLARDLPGMADVDSSLLAFCGDIRRHVKVALSGECADEIFGGYPWYRDPNVRAAEGFPWAQNIHIRTALLVSAISDKVDGHSFVMDAYRKTCLESDILPGNTTEDRRIKEMVNLNFRWFMQTLLDRKDRMSMYHSLEVRVPFCDYRIAEYLYGVPWHMKDHNGKEKGLLRRSMEGILPDGVLYRKKSPYPKTFDPEYERMVSRRLSEILQKDSPLFSVVRRERLLDLLESDSPWPWYGQLMRRPQIMAYMIQLHFWLNAYNVDLRF